MTLAVESNPVADQGQITLEMMRLHVFADREGALIAEWDCNVLATPPGSCRTRDR
jgi:hypothetical protein